MRSHNPLYSTYPQPAFVVVLQDIVTFVNYKGRLLCCSVRNSI
jgi:hypothetical protein